jgi:hypothetical protein
VREGCRLSAATYVQCIVSRVRCLVLTVPGLLVVRQRAGSSPAVEADVRAWRPRSATAGYGVRPSCACGGGRDD